MSIARVHDEKSFVEKTTIAPPIPHPAASTLDRISKPSSRSQSASAHPPVLGIQKHANPSNTAKKLLGLPPNLQVGVESSGELQLSGV